MCISKAFQPGLAVFYGPYEAQTDFPEDLFLSGPLASFSWAAGFVFCLYSKTLRPSSLRFHTLGQGWGVGISLAVGMSYMMGCCLFLSLTPLLVTVTFSYREKAWLIEAGFCCPWRPSWWSTVSRKWTTFLLMISCEWR